MVFTVNGRVGLVEEGKTFGSPHTLIISGACPPPAPSVRAAFAQVAPGKFGCRSLPAPNLAANDATTAARRLLVLAAHPPPHPFAHSLPNSHCRSRAGPQRAVRSGPDGSTGVHGRLTAVNGGKTAPSDARPPGTTVVGRETGRRHLGTVLSGDGPS